MTITVLYHAHCHDGFGAAWAAWRKFGDDARYLPVQHGNPPPELEAESEVFVLDFAYPRQVMLEMRDRYRGLAVVDHHRTAEEDLRGLDFATFDLEKSGAVLAWEYFHPSEPVPELLRYVMDRDLWEYALPDSREVAAALNSHPMDFEVWSGLTVEKLAADGVPILRHQRELVLSVCQQARFERLAEYDVPVVNASLYGSDVGEELLRRYPEAPFVAIYFDRADGKRQWSLRSRDDFDVSRLARRFQNGGHRQAAGFESTIPADFMPAPRDGRG